METDIRPAIALRGDWRDIARGLRWVLRWVNIAKLSLMAIGVGVWSYLLSAGCISEHDPQIS